MSYYKKLRDALDGRLVEAEKKWGDNKYIATTSDYMWDILNILIILEIKYPEAHSKVMDQLGLTHE